jgi:triphosphatase
MLALDDGTFAEVAWDEGAITAGERSHPVCEVELELRGGDPTALYCLAVKLHEDVPFTIESESKAARGYRLRSGEPPETHKAKAVALTGNTLPPRHCAIL